MNWMEKLERKWGRYAIPELHKYFAVAFLIGIVVSWVQPQLLNYVYFSVEHILHGEVWRIVTWIISPQGGADVFTIIFLLCLIPMGKHLEHVIGTFRMNVYLFGGVIISTLCAILVYVISSFTQFGPFPVMLSTYYILLSVFMALAVCMPEAMVYIYGIFPVKMKWMLLVYLLTLGYSLFQYFSIDWRVGIVCGTQIVAALLNLVLFFHFSKIRLSGKQRKRQQEFRQKMKAAEPRPGSNITRHKCAICGRTEKDDPTLTFRYCSKCTGNKEYCQEHLFTHTHV